MSTWRSSPQSCSSCFVRCATFFQVHRVSSRSALHRVRGRSGRGPHNSKRATASNKQHTARSKISKHVRTHNTSTAHQSSKHSATMLTLAAAADGSAPLPLLCLASVALSPLACPLHSPRRIRSTSIAVHNELRVSASRRSTDARPTDAHHACGAASAAASHAHAAQSTALHTQQRRIGGTGSSCSSHSCTPPSDRE